MTEDTHRCSMVSLVIAVAIGIVVGGVALSMVMWLIGGLFHLLFFLVRVGSVVALVAFIVWLLTRRSRARAGA